MQADEVLDILEPSIPTNPNSAVVLVTLLSLVVPGLGQAWLGQWGRGLRLFTGSATLCFGLGAANVIVAYDAFSLARRNRERALTGSTSSKSLWVFTKFWSGFCAVIDSLAESLTVGPGPGFLIALPLMFISMLAGGKGFAMFSR